ncbi:histidine kinase [Pararobbsia alpina]|uniref:PAS domain S-box protein n=1 Tax=Pararobbsia alpina TaxID=621374 RepID=UPI0039A40F3F
MDADTPQKHKVPVTDARDEARRLRALVKAHSRLAAARLDVEHFLQLVTDTLLELVPAATASVVEWIDGDELVYRACSGTNAAHVGMRLGRVGSLSGRCAGEKRILYCADTETDDRVDREACRRVHAASMLVAPLLYDSQCDAVVKVYSSRPAAFDDDDVETLELITSLLATGMAHQRVFAENRTLIAENSVTIAKLRAEVSRREAADERLRAFSMRRRLVLDALPDPYVCVDAAGVIIDWNDAATSLFGGEREAFIGRPIRDALMCPENAAECERSQIFDVQRLPFDRRRIQTTVRRLDCTSVPVEVTACSVPSDGRMETAYFFRDLTPHRLAEESDRRFRILLDALKDFSIAMLDSQGRIATWSAGATVVMGYDADEVIGEPASIFYAPEDVREGRPERDLEAAAQEGHLEFEGWRVRRDGSVFWANIVISALYDANGRVHSFAEVTRDISRRRRLQELEASSQRMSQFLALLGHELRNPLAPLRNTISAIRLQNTDDAFAAEHLVIDRQLAHLTQLVDDLLDAGRVTLGRVRIEKRPVSIKEIIDLSVEGGSHLIREKQQRLSVAMPEEALMIEGDPTRMVQLVQNLLQNAVKFSPPRSEINLRAYRAGRLIAIEVCDTGRGIDASMIDAIFNLFVQETPADEQQNRAGLGIGLTLAQSIAEMHGGHIEVHSLGRDQGSTFTVWVPELDTSPIEDARGTEPASAVADASLRILVVDDNEDSANSMASLASLFGHETQTAYDGVSSIDVARTFEPHLILLDLSMPGMTGFEALPHLRQLPGCADTLIVAMTGLGTLDDKRRTQEAGFDGHLVKPVALDEFEHTVAAAISRFRLRGSEP